MAEPRLIPELRGLAGPKASLRLELLASLGTVLLTAMGTAHGQTPDTPTPPSADTPAQSTTVAPPQGTPTETAPSNGQATVTIEAQRKIYDEVTHFVSSVTIRYQDEAIARWNLPICPQVAGLTRDKGEFVLYQISQVARTAGVQLAGEKCEPNFFVVVSSQPDKVLQNWIDHYGLRYDRTYGIAEYNRALESHSPVRILYNAELRPAISHGAAKDSQQKQMGSSITASGAPSNWIYDRSRLDYVEVKTLNSAFIVVDANRVVGLNMTQLADYVAMAGMTRMRVDANIDAAMPPTILRMFQNPKDAPQSLTNWDQAFLYSLYKTDQTSTQQLPMIRSTMVSRILPN